MIGKIDNNNSVAYDCETGKVIRKFQNFEEDYSVSCEIAPTNLSNLTNIASKSGKHSISIFNYYLQQYRQKIKDKENIDVEFLKKHHINDFPTTILYQNNLIVFITAGTKPAELLRRDMVVHFD